MPPNPAWVLSRISGKTRKSPDLQNMLQLRVFLLAPFLNKYNRVVVDNGWYPLNGLNGWYLKKKELGREVRNKQFHQRHPKTIDWNKQFGLKDACCKLKSIELKTLHPFYPWNTHKNWKCPISISLNKNSVSTWRRWWKIMLFLISMMELGLKKTHQTWHCWYRYSAEVTPNGGEK